MASFLTYVTVDRDRWDLIAERMYGDATNFSGIIASNPSAPIAEVLPLGLTLLVPIIDPPTASVPGPPWSLSRRST